MKTFNLLILLLFFVSLGGCETIPDRSEAVKTTRITIYSNYPSRVTVHRHQYPYRVYPYYRYYNDPFFYGSPYPRYYYYHGW